MKKVYQLKDKQQILENKSSTFISLT